MYLEKIRRERGAGCLPIAFDFKKGTITFNFHYNKPPPKSTQSALSYEVALGKKVNKKTCFIVLYNRQRWSVTFDRKFLK